MGISSITFVTVQAHSATVFPYISVRLERRMARTVRNAKIDSRSARLKLAQRAEPYWTVISEGCALGYRRGSKGGSWVGRYRDDSGKQHYQTLGATDDARDADGLTVFSFAEAQVKANAFFTKRAREIAGGFLCSDNRFTVADAVEAYKAKYIRRGGKDTGRIDSAARNYILPVLGQTQVTALTARKLEQWHHDNATSAARVRTRKGAGLKYRIHVATPEADRKRSASANRVLAILKAALNEAYREGQVSTADSWRRVRAFRKVDTARIRYLSDDEARRFVNVCEPDFRALVTAALMTGCRYMELASLLVADFDAEVGTVTVRMSKSGKPRHVALSGEGSQFFRQQRAGKNSGDSLLGKANGTKWCTSDQQRRMIAACKDAEIEPITFHGLRHTYASRLAMRSVPLVVIAAQLGHADVRMVEKHYGHLAPNYVADTVRAAFTEMGLLIQPIRHLRTASCP
jgi:integrase